MFIGFVSVVLASAMAVYIAGRNVGDCVDKFACELLSDAPAYVVDSSGHRLRVQHGFPEDKLSNCFLHWRRVFALVAFCVMIAWLVTDAGLPEAGALVPNYQVSLGTYVCSQQQASWPLSFVGCSLKNYSLIIVTAYPACWQQTCCLRVPARSPSLLHVINTHPQTLQVASALPSHCSACTAVESLCHIARPLNDCVVACLLHTAG